MHYTYILKSLKQDEAICIDYTNDLKSRLTQYNLKHTGYSNKYLPLGVESYFVFAEQLRAL